MGVLRTCNVSTTVRAGSTEVSALSLRVFRELALCFYAVWALLLDSDAYLDVPHPWLRGREEGWVR